MGRDQALGEVKVYFSFPSPISSIARPAQRPSLHTPLGRLRHKVWDTCCCLSNEADAEGCSCDQSCNSKPFPLSHIKKQMMITCAAPMHLESHAIQGLGLTKPGYSRALPVHTPSTHFVASENHQVWQPWNLLPANSMADELWMNGPCSRGGCLLRLSVERWT